MGKHKGRETKKNESQLKLMAQLNEINEKHFEKVRKFQKEHGLKESGLSNEEMKEFIQSRYEHKYQGTTGTINKEAYYTVLKKAISESKSFTAEEKEMLLSITPKVIDWEMIGFTTCLKCGRHFVSEDFHLHHCTSIDPKSHQSADAPYSKTEIIKGKVHRSRKEYKESAKKARYAKMKEEEILFEESMKELKEEFKREEMTEKEIIADKIKEELEK